MPPAPLSRPGPVSGEQDVLAELHQSMKGRPVYLSWDMDSFDPSVAPGVCTPTWGSIAC